MKTGKYDKNGKEIKVGDIVHFRCTKASLCGKGKVYLANDDGLGNDNFRIIDTRQGKNNGRIYPYYDDAIYRIDEETI